MKPYRDGIELDQKEMMASFRNARRIQKAILRPADEVAQELGNAFIFYRPKHMVSGDFYWTYRKGDKLVMAVGDASGHGIGGAFISILSYGGMKRVVKDKQLESPSEILEALDSYFKSILTLDGSNHIGTLDISVCTLNTATGELEFCGARHPLLLIRNEQIMEFKGNRKSIGDVLYYHHEDYANHKIQLYEDDIIYLFSDGYYDQLGGPDCKRVKNLNYKQLILSISERPMNQQKVILQNFLRSWKREFSQTDDICIMGYKYR